MRGFIDGVRSCGRIEGWAFDPAQAWEPLRVRIKIGARDIADGLACNFRQDLADGGVGTGWTSFTLVSNVDVQSIYRREMRLESEDGSLIHATDNPPRLPPLGLSANSLRDAISIDPTMATSVEQLRGCDAMFTRFIRERGVDGFIRSAYVYVLGRPADKDGLATYGSQLRRGALQPFELLRALTLSDEFTSGTRTLVAPTQRSFPFHVVENRR